MPSSLGQLLCNSVPGAWLEASVTTWPIKTGIVVSRRATMKPVTNSATTSRRAWRA